MHNIFGIKVKNKNIAYEKMLKEADSEFLSYIINRDDFDMQFKNILVDRFVHEANIFDKNSLELMSAIINRVGSQYFNDIFDAENCERALSACASLVRRLEKEYNFSEESLRERLRERKYIEIKRANDIVPVKQGNAICSAEQHLEDIGIKELALKIREVLYFMRDIMAYGNCSYDNIVSIINNFSEIVDSDFFIDVTRNYSFSSGRRSVSESYFNYYLDNISIISNIQKAYAEPNVRICGVFAIGEMINNSQRLSKESIIKACHVIFNKDLNLVPTSQYYTTSEVIMSIYRHKTFDLDIHDIALHYDPIDSAFAMFYQQADLYRYNTENNPNIDMIITAIDAVSHVEMNGLIDAGHERYQEFLNLKNEIREFISHNASSLSESDYLRFVKNML